jgi:hypothetical protein
MSGLHFSRTKAYSTQISKAPTNSKGRGSESQNIGVLSVQLSSEVAGAPTGGHARR